MPERRVAVVGGGLIGLATAYALLRHRRGRYSVTVIEKEPAVGQHQSTHNSGVLHAGLYYAPGSLKARMAVEGLRRMTRFCEERGVPYEICGKLVVAVEQAELVALRRLYERGRANGLRGLRWLDGQEAREIEPHVRAVAAVQVPEEGIVDYRGVCDALAAVLQEEGGVLRLGAAVEGIERVRRGWRLRTPREEIRVEGLVNCAGLHSDRVARLAGEDTAARIVPFRGEYFELRPESAGLVRNLVYPVPDASLPFLGVHFTRMIGGGVEAGPNAVLALAREGYDWRRVSLRDASEALAFPGIWRFLSRYPGTTVSEVLRSFSRVRFARALQRLIPEVCASDLLPGTHGVRAQAMTADGTLVQDFLLLERPGAVHVLNAPSPGATASLCIGEEVADRLARQLS